MTTDEHWKARTDRILALLAEQSGLARMGTGPMDPEWRQRRDQVRRDLAEILAEQREPEVEFR
jgi:hypothetical protein